MNETQQPVKKFLTAEDILSAEDTTFVDVDVPEWGGTVKLRSLTGDDAVKFMEAAGANKAGSAMKIVLACAVKDDGITPLFTEDQFEKIKQKRLSTLLRLQKAALVLNGLTDEAATATKNA